MGQSQRTQGHVLGPFWRRLTLYSSRLIVIVRLVIHKCIALCQSHSIINVDLSDAEHESVAYIAGAVLKNVADKLWEPNRNLKSNGQGITFVDEEIAIVNTCKESKEEISDGLGSTTTSTKLIEALNRGGLIFPKTAVIIGECISPRSFS